VRAPPGFDAIEDFAGPAQVLHCFPTVLDEPTDPLHIFPPLLPVVDRFDCVETTFVPALPTGRIGRGRAVTMDDLWNWVISAWQLRR
jgi:hypothetical protein